MRDTFIAGKVDFSGIDGQYDLLIGEVKHQSIMEINEEGTEAAVATVVKKDKSAGFSLTQISLSFLSSEKTKLTAYFL